MEEAIADLEGKLHLTDGERVIINPTASKLRMYDAKFHKYHYRLVDYIHDVIELEAKQRIFDDHDRRMMDFFRRMTNLQPLEKIVKSPPKPAEETIYSTNQMQGITQTRFNCVRLQH